MFSMASPNYIRNVAIVGAGGNLGTFITRALLTTGYHNVTALTRVDSSSQLPSGITTKPIDYSNPATIVDALRSQEVLIITLGIQVPTDTDEILIRAAAEAGVKWILPNEWSPDTGNEALVRDVPAFQPKAKIRALVASIPTLSYIALSTGFWYEYSLALPPCFGIDITNRTAELFDDGDVPISVSTWPDIGATVSTLLSLPLTPSSTELSLSALANTHLHTCSFTLSQTEMLASLHRTLPSQPAEWKLVRMPARERYATALREMAQGDATGYVKAMYARVFWDDGCGDFEREGGVGIVDVRLGERMRKERGREGVDAGTRVAVERARARARAMGDAGWSV